MRRTFLTWLYKVSQESYTALFKKSSQPWGITRGELLNYPPETLGYALGEFLERHGFELIPKVERHDVYHILTGLGISVEEEIAMQYLCLGNGKKSLYLIGAIMIGTIIMPEHWRLYLRSYQKGTATKPFYHLAYENLLHHDFRQLKENLGYFRRSRRRTAPLHRKISSLS